MQIFLLTQYEEMLMISAKMLAVSPLMSVSIKLSEILNLCAMYIVGSQAVRPVAMSDPDKERTFIMIKPDGVHRGLVGDIIKRFEQKGFKLVAMKFLQVCKGNKP